MNTPTHRWALGAIALLLGGGACGSAEKADKNPSNKDAEAEEGAKPSFSESDSSEAKNNLSAIARAAVGAYERESVAATELVEGEPSEAFVHALCKTATAFPAKLPEKGATVEPTDTDWGGDGTTGWMCLKFGISTPVHFQYSYIAGGPYKGKGRVTDPGPDGFQACAEADLVPGGETTLLCVTGKVDKTLRIVRLATELEERLE